MYFFSKNIWLEFIRSIIILQIHMHLILTTNISKVHNVSPYWLVNSNSMYTLHFVTPKKNQHSKTTRQHYIISLPKYRTRCHILPLLFPIATTTMKASLRSATPLALISPNQLLNASTPGNYNSSTLSRCLFSLSWIQNCFSLLNSST